MCSSPMDVFGCCTTAISLANLVSGQQLPSQSETVNELAMQLEWTENVATADEIAEHLKCCAPLFVARLRRRVDLDKYSHKIFKKATRFEAWEKQLLVGLVAAYLTDPFDRSVGFVTNVSVLETHKGNGVAGRLLATCRERAVAAGLTVLRLEVDSDNTAALSLYKKIGYTIVDDGNEVITMQRQCGII